MWLYVGDQQLCSATVSNWRRNTAHVVDPSNLGGFAAPVPFPVLWYAPRSAWASTFSTASELRVERPLLGLPLLASPPGPPGPALQEGPPSCLAISSRRFRVSVCRDVYNSSCISPILASSFLRRRLSRNWVSIDRVWIDNWIYWALLQLMTTVHRPLSRTDSCSQSRCLAAASNGGYFSASGLTSLQGGDHLMPTSYTDRWFQLVLPSAPSSRAALTYFHLPNSKFSSQFSTGFRAKRIGF
jgi:hypothetical protein